MIVLGWLCLAAGIGFTIYYAYTQRAAVRCQSIVVNINPNSPRFLDEEEIAKMVENAGEQVIGRGLFLININKIEKKLAAFTTLDNIQIYRRVDSKGLSFKGKLVVNVDERSPVLRIKTGSDDFYLDRGGVKIPVSQKYIDRILIATGVIPDEKLEMDFLKMAEYINKDDFWRAQIEQVLVQSDGQLIMLPQVGDYLIEFGTPDDYVLKLRNLKAVYQQGFKNMGWNKYKTISIKYRNQVVCTKK